MELVSTISEIAASAIDVILIVYFFNGFFGRNNKHSKIIKFVILILLFLNGQFLTEYYVLQVVFHIALVFLYSVMFVKGNYLYKICSIVVLILVTAVLNTLVFQGVLIIAGASIEVTMIPGGVVRIICICIAKSFMFFLIYIVIYKGNNSILSLKHNEWILIITYFLSTTIISMVLLNIVVSVDMNDIKKINMVMVVVLLMGTTVLSFGLIGRMNKQNEIQSANEILKMQVEQQRESVIKTQRNYELVQQVRHDIKRHLTVISELVRQERDKEAVQYIREVTDEKQYEKVTYLSGNEVISAVINEKTAICKQKGISMRVDATAAIQKDREFNMAIVLSNLLDNAIEATEKMSEGAEITLQVFRYKAFYNIVIRNTIEESVLKKNPLLLTTKENKNAHGIGLPSIKTTVSKYDGFFQVCEEKGKFVVHIMVSNNWG